MNLRLIVLSALAASATTFAMSANAHDPKEFDRMMTTPVAKAVPTTCMQLADTANYTADLGNPEIKALKVRCDKAGKRAAAKAKVAASAKAKAAASSKAAVQGNTR